MAKYDREFLVPYLQDICSLHLLEDRLDKSIYHHEKTIRDYQRGKVAQKPQEPRLNDTSIGCLGVVIITFFVITCVSTFFALFCVDMSRVPWAKWILIFGVGLFGWFSYEIVSESIEMKRDNKRIIAAYEKTLREYQRYCAQLEREHRYELTLIPGLSAERIALQTELNKVLALREKAYNANVIPKNYRNKYVAVYLYEWFSTSAADDLDHALSMFVLEEIKARLDRIIENQSEEILNQRIMLANQRSESEERRKHEIQMMNKLQHLQSTEEENLRYQRMIESNTAATAYFAAANYFSRI